MLADYFKSLHFWLLLALLGAAGLYQALLGNIHRRAHATDPSCNWTKGDVPEVAASPHRVVAVVLPTGSGRAAATTTELSAGTQSALASFADGLILIAAQAPASTAADAAAAAAAAVAHGNKQDSSSGDSSSDTRQLVRLNHSIVWHGDAAAALNQAADVAEAAGAAWMFVLSAGDGLQVQDNHLQLEQLSLTSSSMLYCYVTGGRLEAQACLFRLPLPGHFEGPVRAILVPAAEAELALNSVAESSCCTVEDNSDSCSQAGREAGEGCSTEEQADAGSSGCSASGDLPPVLPLDAAAIAGITINPAWPDQAMLQQQLRALRRHLNARPPRKAWWLLQMAQAFEAAGNEDLAAQHYALAYDASTSRQLAAWAMYQLAALHTNTGNNHGVLEAASKGMARLATPELLWIASLASYRSRNMAQAIAWAEMAASIGCMSTGVRHCILLRQPVVFADLSAWHEHPFDVLRYAYGEVLNEAAEDAADEKHEAAKVQVKQLLAAAARGRQSVVIGGLQALAHLDEAEDACKPAAPPDGKAQRKPRIAASITTAHRPELFQRSWHSFRGRCLDCDALVQRWYAVDDGSSREHLALMQKAAPQGAVVWLPKAPEQAGHVGSLNVLLDEVMRRGFDYLLHLEDDWFFFRDEEFIAQALAVMEAEPLVAQVLLNPNYRDTDAAWESDGLYTEPELLTPDGVRYILHTFVGPRRSHELAEYQKQHGITKASNLHWPGFALRPGLWRLSAVARAGRFQEVAGFEEAFGLKLHDLGLKTAYLPEVSCIHLAPTSTWLQDKDINGVFERHGLRLTHRSKTSAYDSNAAER